MSSVLHVLSLNMWMGILISNHFEITYITSHNQGRTVTQVISIKLWSCSSFKCNPFCLKLYRNENNLNINVESHHKWNVSLHANVDSIILIVLNCFKNFTFFNNLKFLTTHKKLICRLALIKPAEALINFTKLWKCLKNVLFSLISSGSKRLMDLCFVCFSLIQSVTRNFTWVEFNGPFIKYIKLLELLVT